MKAELIAVGTELLLGQIVNTNAAMISERLAALGIDVYYHVVVGDNAARLADTFRRAWRRSDAVITTGGLGPTADDLTKEVVAEVLGLPLREDPGARRDLEVFFQQRRLPMPESNLKQALVPQGGLVIKNEAGTAPGIIVKKDGKIAVMLPGPPREVTAMLPAVLSHLQEMAGRGTVILSRVLKVCGAGEAAVEEKLHDLIVQQSNPTIAPLAQLDEVHLRITAKAADKEKARALIRGTENAIRERLGPLVYGADDETLEEAVGVLLRERGLTVAVAESCTAGLVSHRLTAMPGSSAHFRLGVAAYANEAKVSLLGVSRELLAQHGAVSAEVALAMARGAMAVGETSVGVSVTGIAGPGGGSEDKPVGTVFLAVCGPWGERVVERRYWGDRRTIRLRAVQDALVLLRREVMTRGYEGPEREAE